MSELEVMINPPPPPPESEPQIIVYEPEEDPTKLTYPELGGATIREIADAPPVSPRFAAQLGIPLSDLDAGAATRPMEELRWRRDRCGPVATPPRAGTIN